MEKDDDNDLINNKELLLKILQKLEKIEEDVLYLKNLSLENKKNCDKMSEHIDFVDDAYEKFKHPLNALKDMISWRSTKLLK